LSTISFLSLPALEPASEESECFTALGVLQLWANISSFAWMEILKAMVLLFKLFDVERLNDKPTVIREGFFNKAAECEVKVRRRQ
jgi:hypothetical protein